MEHLLHTGCLTGDELPPTDIDHLIGVEIDGDIGGGDAIPREIVALRWGALPARLAGCHAPREKVEDTGLAETEDDRFIGGLRASVTDIRRCAGDDAVAAEEELLTDASFSKGALVTWPGPSAGAE